MKGHYRKAYSGRIQAVIFDWAGTTVDHGCCAPAGVFVEVFRRRGVEITDAEARGPMGLHKRDHIREVTQMPAVSDRWAAAVGSRPSEADVESMFEEFIPLQLDIIADYADLIPETLGAQEILRDRGIRIGSTTGYNREMMDILTAEAARRGYQPDSVAVASEVPAGRPAPWMIHQNLQDLEVYPAEACIKVGDTPADVAEGLNAGVWSVAVVQSSNEMGLNLADLQSCPPRDRADQHEWATQRLARAGAHYLMETLDELEGVIDQVEFRLRRGEKP